MSQSIKTHEYTEDGERETYVCKFKDKPDRAGIKIADPMGRVMRIKEIQVYKMPRETNKIVIEILKDAVIPKREKPVEMVK